MGKIVKTWERISFWNKARGMITALGATTEAGLYMKEVGGIWQTLALILIIVGVIITYIFEDKDNNGIADVFEKPEELRHKETPKE